MADATTATESTNIVEIEDIGPARKRVKITVPAAAVAEKLEDSIGTLATETLLPGFRKGKAPRKLLERRFGKTVRAETRNQLMADAFASAVESNDLHPVGEPEPADDMDIDEIKISIGEDLTFAFDVEVVPDFDLPELEKIPVKRPMLEVTEDHIVKELERQLIRIGMPERVSGEFQARDRLLAHVKVFGKDSDEVLFNRDVILVVPDEDQNGRGQILGLLIDDLTGTLKDKSVGDTFTIKTVGPDGHERDDFRNAELSVEVHLKESERIIPATMEAAIGMYGITSEEEFRDQIKMALDDRLRQEQAAAMREQVHEYLIEHVEFELPEKLSEAQLSRAIEQQHNELASRGMPIEQIETRLAEMRADAEELGQKRLKLFFILHRLAKHFEVEVSEQDLNGRIASLAVQRGVRPEQLKNELVQSGRLDEIARVIRDEKCMDRVLQSATMTEVSADDWNEQIRERSGAAAGGSTKPASTRTTKKTSKKKKKTTTKKTSKKTSSK